MGTLLVILVAALVLFVLLGGAITWVVVAWIRHMWNELRRTPTFGQVSRGVGMARPILAYRDALRRAPARATELVVAIQRKATALEGIKEQLGPEPRFRVAETTRRYLPDTMEAYRIAIVGQGRDQRLEASRLLLEQLTQIDRNLDRIATGAGETGIAALRANGAFLGEIAARPPLPSGDDGAPAASTPPQDDPDPGPDGHTPRPA